MNPARSAEPDAAELAASLAAAESAIEALENEKVEDWVRLIRFGGTIPLAVENSLSWRLTRPIRLGQTAMLVLRRDGFNKFWATVFYRLRRLVTRA